VQPPNNGKTKYFLPTIKRTDLIKISNATVYDYEDIQNAISDFTKARDPRQSVEYIIKIITDPCLVQGQSLIINQTPFDQIPDHKFFAPSDAKSDIMVLPGVTQEQMEVVMQSDSYATKQKK